MEKYILTKTQKGKKYLYEVKDENGNVVSKRTSTRDYVACSVSGEFYFGRLDLVGKGDYGKRLAGAQKRANYSTSVYMADREAALKEAPGEFYAVTESDIWLMRYHKNILFAVNCKTTRKNKFEIKVFIFGD